MSRHCPKDAGLIRLSAFETGPDESERLFRHLADCPRCSARFAILRQLEKDLRPKVEAFAREFDAERAGPLLASAARQKLRAPVRSPTASRPSSRPSGPWLKARVAAGVLAVLAVVVGGIFLTATRSAEYSHLRSPSIGPTLIEPAGTIPAPPAVFRWSPVPNAENYVFELYDDSLERVHSCSTFLINELVLGAEIKAKLIKGGTYLWTISARDGDGDLLASRSVTFAIE